MQFSNFNFQIYDKNSHKQTIIDMPGSSDMRAQVIKQAKFVADTFKIENKITKHIKQKIDEKYGPNWNCVVGKTFLIILTIKTLHFILGGSIGCFIIQEMLTQSN